MRFPLRLLLTLSLIWCGLHLAEPANARGAHDGQTSIAALLDADCGEDGSDAERTGHLHHHHCPVAADPNAAAAGAYRFAPAALPFRDRFTALHSLSRAPPLQPPSA